MFTPVTWSRRPSRWLLIIGVFELALAGVFFFIGQKNELIRGGFTLTAAILGLVGVGLLFWGRKWGRAVADADRIKAQGVAGTATILGMRQTGAFMNEQPQVELRLQVSTQMHGAYEATVKEWVPLMLLGTLTSGRPLPVKVDPANPQRVIIEWEAAGGTGAPAAGMPVVGQPLGGIPLAGQTGAMQPPQGDPADIKKRLLETGVSGTAKVISSAPTGQVDAEGRSVYSMMLEIHVEGRPTIQGPAVVGVPPERAELLEVGDTVPIKADAGNPAMMAVDWDNA